MKTIQSYSTHYTFFQSLSYLILLEKVIHQSQNPWPEKLAPLLGSLDRVTNNTQNDSEGVEVELQNIGSRGSDNPHF